MVNDTKETIDINQWFDNFKLCCGAMGFLQPIVGGPRLYDDFYNDGLSGKEAAQKFIKERQGQS